MSSVRTSSAGTNLSVRILGQTVIEAGDRLVEPAPPKYRQVLALLAFKVGETVSVDTIVDELWPHDPPRTAVTTAQTYIYGLRRLMDTVAGAEVGKMTIRTRRPGYVLTMERASIDVHRFRASVNDARSHLHRDPVAAVALLRETLAMAPSYPLADVPLGPVLTTYADELREEALAVQQMAITLEMSTRRPDDLVGELRALTAAHPLRENFAELLIRALYRANRRAEALEVFRDLRKRLDGELGIEPCGSVQELHQEVLRTPAAAPSWPAAPGPDAPPAGSGASASWARAS